MSTRALAAGIVAALLVLAMTLGVAAGAYRLAQAKAEAQHERDLSQYRLEAQKQAMTAERAEAELQAWRAARQPRIEATTRDLIHETKAAPEWARQPLPDGVRNTLAAALSATGARAASSPARPLPASGAASAH